MSYRNNRFANSHLSLENILNGYADPSKAKVLSDNGTALERLLDALDYSPEAEREREKLEEAETRERKKNRVARLGAAIARLCAADKAYLVPTLLLIATYGANRDRSIALSSLPTYYRNRSLLLEFFT